MYLTKFLSHSVSVRYASINRVSIGWNYVLLPVRRQAKSWTDADVLSFETQGTNFIAFSIEIFSSNKMRLKMPSAKVWAILFRGRWVKAMYHLLNLINWPRFQITKHLPLTNIIAIAILVCHSNHPEHHCMMAEARLCNESNMSPVKYMFAIYAIPCAFCIHRWLHYTQYSSTSARCLSRFLINNLLFWTINSKLSSCVRTFYLGYCFSKV